MGISSIERASAPGGAVLDHNPMTPLEIHSLSVAHALLRAASPFVVTRFPGHLHEMFAILVIVPPSQIRDLAALCGFELAGVAAALPHPDAPRYDDWIARGLAGRMAYLTDHRAAIRQDPRRLLPSARSIICVGKLYNGPEPYSTRFDRSELAWISRYAWGDDYHDGLRAGMERLTAKLSPDR